MLTFDHELIIADFNLSIINFTQYGHSTTFMGFLVNVVLIWIYGRLDAFHKNIGFRALIWLFINIDKNKSIVIGMNAWNGVIDFFACIITARRCL